MDVAQIMDAVKTLPMGQKKVLAYKVIGEIDRIEKMESVTQRWDTVFYTAVRLSGYNYTTGSRDARSVLIRTVAAWRLIEEGYPFSDIGRAMGKDHSTVSYYAKQRRDALQLPIAYREHLTLYGKLVLALSNDD